MECPECKARYLIPDQALGVSGRTVRCAKCAHTWFQMPSGAVPVMNELDKMLDDINARPKPIPKGSNLPVIRREKVSLALRISVFAMGAIAIALILFTTLPGLFGLQHSTGIVLADVAIVKLAADQHSAYQINGKISNTTDTAMLVPTLRVTVVDADGTSLQYWDFNGNARILVPGSAMPFSTDNLEIRFSKASRFVLELGNPLELALRRKPG